MQLLWKGLMAYVARFDIDLMFGCASLPGIDVGEMALPLSYLHHFHAMPEDLRVQGAARTVCGHEHACPRTRSIAREALRSLPPLLKGYVRAGCCIGDGAVIDRQFGTTDVFIYFPLSGIDARYKSRFGLGEIAVCGFGVQNLSRYGRRYSRHQLYPSTGLGYGEAGDGI